jgi:hypothetical protein
MNVPHSHVFFTDRDLGKRFPKILKDAGVKVEKHGDHFADDAKDEEWLEKIGELGWFALTHDQRIRYKPNEIAAVKKFRVGLFVLVGKAPFHELAYNFINTLPKIEKFINKNSRPFIAKIYRPDQKSIELKQRKSGSVQMWVSFKEIP